MMPPSLLPSLVSPRAVRSGAIGAAAYALAVVPAGTPARRIPSGSALAYAVGSGLGALLARWRVR